ncbi:ParB-like protein [Sphingomonas sp. ASV193]|uniref:ParB-like protein n=1 Tax=Sphingomonas sp. ASV193 TaxID=3144405 RepID=UPI0032E87D9D
MRTSRDPILTPLAIKDLRPTQITVGFREVEQRRAKMREIADEKVGSYLGRHMIPVVIGPKKKSYVIDHHHLARALLEEGQERVLVTPVANLHRLALEDFWRFLDNSGWLHPFDENGRRLSYDEIPKRIAKLRDDPFRSLAGAVRQEGGYAKEAKPFTEFIWADYFRRHFSAKQLDHHWEACLAKALILAKAPHADFLPGWCGPD